MLHRDCRPTGSRCCMACMSTSRARQLDAVLDPDNVFVFDAAGRLVALGAAACCARRRPEECSMARIDLVDLAHSYGGEPAPTEGLCAASR